MKRNLNRLADTCFDLVIIGGGIYGAWMAKDAAIRGLRVALVEKNDFGHATSFNSLKIIHGGFRYLQHLDIRRMRESIQERSVLLRIAPHLVRPIPFLIPTYGYGMQSKELMRVALALNDVIGFDRNEGVSEANRLRRGYVLSKSECLQIVPGLNPNGLTGAAIWHDCQLSSSERLMMAVLKGATDAGAEIANYVKATGLLRRDRTITGIQAVDELNGEAFDIQAKFVVNATGPWAQEIHHWIHPHGAPLHLSKAMNLVVRVPLVSKFAVGVSSRNTYQDPQARFHKGHRLFFMVPWKHYTLIGTTHTRYEGNAHDFQVTDADLDDFICEMNDAYPPAQLTRNNICFVYAGLLPMNAPQKRHQDVSLLKQSLIFDLERENGIRGLLSVVGVKLTEARLVAEKTIDIVCDKFGQRFPPSQTANMPVDGGSLDAPETFLDRESPCTRPVLSSATLRHLISRYGSSYGKILEYACERPDFLAPLSRNSLVSVAEVLHAIHEEMAVRLPDLVRRRTELGSFENPGDALLAVCAELMAKELDWSEIRRQKELEAVRNSYEQSPFTRDVILNRSEPHPVCTVG